jgi:hypothetical protein
MSSVIDVWAVAALDVPPCRALGLRAVGLGGDGSHENARPSLRARSSVGFG